MVKFIRRAAFLDRDGVLSKSIIKKGKGYAPKSLKDFKLFPYSKQSVKKLQNAGFLVIVVTNQPDVGNKIVKKELIERMHEVLFDKTNVDDIFACYHRQKDRCSCRKPKSGMLIRASQKHKINLNKSFIVGDRCSDIEAGEKVGCKTVFIDRKYIEKKPIKHDISVHSLKAATLYILNHYK